jgi:hypothetical protein
MRYLPIALFALAACETLPDVSLLVTPDQPATVILFRGQHALIGSEPLEIVFRDVVEDSRCPTDVTCVWAGNGKVRLRLTLGTGSESTADLNTGLLPSRTEVGPYRITLVELSPDPVSTASIPPERYRINLLVELPASPN